ncbi:hypothetical protein ROZALSC1DRAFT_31632, partial [Rozella allomycis CSF55]
MEEFLPSIINSSNRKYIPAVSIAGFCVLISAVYSMRQRNDSELSRNKSLQALALVSRGRSLSNDDLKDDHKRKGGVNKVFVKQLLFLLRILIPSYKSKECLMVILHTIFLVLRTYLSVVGARVDGVIAKNIIGGNLKQFGKSLCWWFALAVPSVFTNSMIKYF